MNNHMSEKYFALTSKLKNYGSAAIAFSGGVDSTFLARAAHDALGNKAIAITVVSEAYPPDSIVQIRNLAERIGIRLIEIPISITEVSGFAENEPDRCYHCKKQLFVLMGATARDNGVEILMDGSNVDDDADYRPGKRALAELGVVSPLKDAGYTKDDIRADSRELELPTWNMQSFACLASRFPYGDRITPDLLERTWKAEAVLKELGIRQYRVRNHDSIARIEVNAEGMDILMKPEVRLDVVTRLKKLGYSYVTLDLQGFRTGSMNETLGAVSPDSDVPL